jgi:hypothetical protein
MMTKKKKAYRMFPVQSDINPTMSGPKNEDDCEVPSQINDVTEYTAHAQHTLSVMENRPYLWVNIVEVWNIQTARDIELTILLPLQEGSSPHTKLEHTLGRLHKQHLLNSQMPLSHDE